MLDGDALFLAEGIDAPKPLPHAGEQLHAAAALHQKIAVQPFPLSAALRDHGVHISQEAVHPVVPSEGVGLVPELGGGVPQRGDKGVVLHVGGTQRLVEIVQQRDDRLVRHLLSSLFVRAAPPEPPFFFAGAIVLCPPESWLPALASAAPDRWSSGCLSPQPPAAGAPPQVSAQPTGVFGAAGCFLRPLTGVSRRRPF